MLYNLAKSVTVAMIATLLLTKMLFSQDFPTYEGVYVWADGDQWQKLSPLRKGPESLQVRSQTGGDNVTSFKYSFQTLNEVDFPTFPIDASVNSNPLKIVIVSRTEELRLVNFVVPFEAYVGLCCTNRLTAGLPLLPDGPIP